MLIAILLTGLLIIIANETKKLNKIQKIILVSLLWGVLMVFYGRFMIG